MLKLTLMHCTNQRLLYLLYFTSCCV